MLFDVSRAEKGWGVASGRSRKQSVGTGSKGDELAEGACLGDQLLGELHSQSIGSWSDIDDALDSLVARAESVYDLADTRCELPRAIGFITFEYGIDGVSMEIAKYAACFEQLGDRYGQVPSIHLLGGNFSESVDCVLAPRWHRHLLPESNGWSKWCGGAHFSRLFYEDMPEGSSASAEMAGEIWRQALDFAGMIADYVHEKDIDLLIPVNVNSNPGNPALALGIVLASESLNLPVINSNHDFFWESGKPASEYREGEARGERDHFFYNCENQSFFRWFWRMFPWNGRRWLQLVINEVQREVLLNTGYHFDSSRVIELGTFIEDNFFAPCRPEHRADLRLHLGLILGNGQHMITSTRLDDFEADLDGWMKQQVPVVLGSESGGTLDVTDKNALWFLQPTRIVTRKRIFRDWELIGTLLDYVPFRMIFDDNPDMTLTLHVTGPVPIEHQADLMDVLSAFRKVLDRQPPSVRRRIFFALSAGHLGHSAFQKRSVENLTVADLYQLADMILLPSSTEGRGLPILESAAAGVPLVCSRYQPREAFENVIGENLAPELQIKYSAFPEGEFNTVLLQEVTDIVFMPEYLSAQDRHNRCAVAARFGMRNVTQTFEKALAELGVAEGSEAQD